MLDMGVGTRIQVFKVSSVYPSFFSVIGSVVISGVQIPPPRKIPRSYPHTSFIKLTNLDLSMVSIYKTLYLILVGTLNSFKYK